MEPLSNTMSTSNGSYASSRSGPPSTSTSSPPQRTIYHVQHNSNAASHQSSADLPVLQQSREALSSWTPISHQPNPTNPAAHTPWPLATHHRKSSSGSSSSSDSTPTYMVSVLSCFIHPMFHFSAPSPFQGAFDPTNAPVIS